MRFQTLLLAASATILISGCGQKTTAVVPGGGVVTEQGDKTTYEDNRGNKIETTEDGGKVDATFTDGEGNTMTMKSDQNGDFTQTGLDAYGSTFVVEGKTYTSTTSANGMTNVTAIQYTRDDPKKVADHFRPQFDVVNSETAVNDGYIFSAKKGDRDITLTITKAEEGTQIGVMSVKKES